MSVLSFVQQVFPPPKLITLPSVGVDVSDSSLKYIRFEKESPHKKELTLTKWGDIDIPEGTVERGNVHNVDNLAQTLKEMKRRTGAEYISISLPEERAYIFETTIASDTHPKEIRGLLEFRLEENVPLASRDAYFDYDVVSEDTDSKQLRVVVAVYAQSTIHSYYEACKKAGLVPLAFEIEAQGIARSTIPKNDMGTYMLVDFGKTRMGVGIVHRGVLMYTSTIEVSGIEMSDDMRAILGEETPESELTNIKNTRGLSQTGDNKEIALALEKHVRNMANELSVRIHYWHTRDVDKEAREIKNIIICGGSSNLFGLPEFLSSELQIPTERAQVWTNAFSLEKKIPPITRRYSYGYATAIGLALKNFYSP